MLLFERRRTEHCGATKDPISKKPFPVVITLSAFLACINNANVFKVRSPVRNLRHKPERPFFGTTSIETGFDCEDSE
jgi:hypothetical protein